MDPRRIELERRLALLWLKEFGDGKLSTERFVIWADAWWPRQTALLTMPIAQAVSDVLLLLAQYPACERSIRTFAADVAGGFRTGAEV